MAVNECRDPEDTALSEAPQARFERAVRCVIGQLIRAGGRVDLAVADYLSRHPIERGEHHLRPDLIICVADGLDLLRAVGPRSIMVSMQLS